MHPMSKGAKAAIGRYLDSRSLDGTNPYDRKLDEDVQALFARLINADPAEVAYVQSTTTGENLVVQALDLANRKGRIVVDTLHFFGSFYLYQELARKGLEVVWLKDRDGRIPLSDYKAAITPGTLFVAVSSTSTINGYQADLKRICEMAHAVGAYVYADIIHSAGCTPFDVKASGVDFAATASYKWLMGDFGLGFLYVAKDVQPKLTRSVFGYYQLDQFQTHLYPFDPPGESIADYAPSDDAGGLFAIGTHAHTVGAQLKHSLHYLLDLGIDRIEAARQPLIEKLKVELPKRGYQMLTPPDSTSPLVACAYQDARALSDRLAARKVKISLSRNRFRLSVAAYNNMDDIDAFLDALG